MKIVVCILTCSLFVACGTQEKSKKSTKEAAKVSLAGGEPVPATDPVGKPEPEPTPDPKPVPGIEPKPEPEPEPKPQVCQSPVQTKHKKPKYPKHPKPTKVDDLCKTFLPVMGMCPMNVTKNGGSCSLVIQGDIGLTSKGGNACEATYHMLTQACEMGPVTAAEWSELTCQE